MRYFKRLLPNRLANGPQTLHAWSLVEPFLKLLKWRHYVFQVFICNTSGATATKPAHIDRMPVSGIAVSQGWMQISRWLPIVERCCSPTALVYLISCPDHNSITGWNILTRLHTWIDIHPKACRAQEPQLSHYYFWRYTPLLFFALCIYIFSIFNTIGSTLTRLAHIHHRDTGCTTVSPLCLWQQVHD